MTTPPTPARGGDALPPRVTEADGAVSVRTSKASARARKRDGSHGR